MNGNLLGKRRGFPPLSQTAFRLLQMGFSGFGKGENLASPSEGESGVEDIRTYLDGTGESYHKGETHPSATVFGMVLIATGLMWLVQGAYFFLIYGDAFQDAVALFPLEYEPNSILLWVLCGARLGMGAACLYFGFKAFDMRQSFLIQAWILVPAYIWFWGGYFSQMDPGFRAGALALDKLFYTPMGFLVFASMLLSGLCLLVCSGFSWAFKPSPRDLGLIGNVVAAAAVGMTLQAMFRDLPPVIRNTALLTCTGPLDDPASGIPQLKLVALSDAELACQANMDELKAALVRLIEVKRQVKYSAHDDRPGGERLLRQMQQMVGLRTDLACPSSGWYRVHRDNGLFRCSVHGDWIPPEDREIGGLDNPPEDAEGLDSGFDSDPGYE